MSKIDLGLNFSNFCLQFNRKTKLALCIGLIGIVILSLILAWWQRYQDQLEKRNTRLLLKSFYFTNKESLAALDVLKQQKIARTLSGGQQDLVRLKSAAVLVQKHDLQGAACELKSVLENSKIAELRTLALVRLVRLTIELNKVTESTKLLEQYRDWLPTLVTLELQGDVAYASSKLQEARACYLKAWQSDPDEMTCRRLMLKMLSC